MRHAVFFRLRRLRYVCPSVPRACCDPSGEVKRLNRRTIRGYGPEPKKPDYSCENQEILGKFVVVSDHGLIRFRRTGHPNRSDLAYGLGFPRRSRFGAFFLTLLADRHLEHARSQAPAWERAVLEALPPEDVDQTTIRQAEPGLCDK